MSLSNQMIIVVEDDAPMRVALVDILELRGADADNIRSFADGGEALAFLEEEKVGNAIVICDLAMPHVNGLQFYKKAHPKAPGLKFLFITAYELMRTEQRILESEDLEILHKPFTTAELIATIEKVTEQE